MSTRAMGGPGGPAPGPEAGARGPWAGPAGRISHLRGSSGLRRWKRTGYWCASAAGRVSGYGSRVGPLDFAPWDAFCLSRGCAVRQQVAKPLRVSSAPSSVCLPSQDYVRHRAEAMPTTASFQASSYVRRRRAAALRHHMTPPLPCQCIVAGVQGYSP